jgi:mono/diheme cytochrome c family protein
MTAPKSNDPMGATRRGRRLTGALRHPFWQAVFVLLLCYLFFKFGIAYLPPLVGIASAPVPQTVLLQYMLTALVGVLVYASADEARWRTFREPLHAVLVDGDKHWLRLALLVVIPLLVGFVAYEQTRPRVSAPVQLRSIHPAPPSQITFRGRAIQLAGLENPLRRQGSMADHIKVGKRIYYQNCVSCHGDRLDGQGHYAHGFSPTPASFEDNGTIAQLTESYVFWRVAKGGPGLPLEGAPWNSAMPVWEDFLTEEEIWSVIIFLYAQTGWQPRRWEEAVTEHENPPGTKVPSSTLGPPASAAPGSGKVSP